MSKYRCIRILVYSGLSDEAGVKASNSNNFEAAVASLAQFSKLRLDKNLRGRTLQTTLTNQAIIQQDVSVP